MKQTTFTLCIFSEIFLSRTDSSTRRVSGIVFAIPLGFGLLINPESEMEPHQQPEEDANPSVAEDDQEKIAVCGDAPMSRMPPSESPGEAPPVSDTREEETAAGEALPDDPIELAKVIDNKLRELKTAKAVTNVWMNMFMAEVAKRKGITHDALQSIFMDHDERARGWCDKETCKYATLHQIARIMGDQGV